MDKKDVYELKIEQIFESLIPPLSTDEYKLLEDNLKKDGCREPICVWNKIIIDGHNRYKICTSNNIPFHIQDMFFENKEEVIDWICANQLGRRNISDETRRYLIGKRYETEKIISANKNQKGKNQYSELKTGSRKLRKDIELAEEYNIACSTVRLYAKYSSFIDKLSEKNPKLTSEIFSGKQKISLGIIKRLSKKHKKSIDTYHKQLQKSIEVNGPIPVLPQRSSSKKEEETFFKVKELPKYDPDADILSLTYTIPSWVSSIERTFNLINFGEISNKAKNKACEELKRLKETVDVMIETMEDL